MQEFFDGAESIDAYFIEFEKGLLESELDSSYCSLYIFIQERIKPSRDILNEFSKYLYEIHKEFAWVENFKKMVSFKFTGKNGDSILLLVSALMNINSYSVKLDLTATLVDLLSPYPRGNIPDNVMREINAKVRVPLLNYLSINYNINDNEFRFLISIMNMNLNSNMRSWLLEDYVKIINAHYGRINSVNRYNYYM